jgi:hypothetical protein
VSSNTTVGDVLLTELQLVEEFLHAKRVVVATVLLDESTMTSGEAFKGALADDGFTNSQGDLVNQVDVGRVVVYKDGTAMVSFGRFLLAKGRGKSFRCSSHILVQGDFFARTLDISTDSHLSLRFVGNSL